MIKQYNQWNKSLLFVSGVKQGGALMLLVQRFGADVNAFSRQGYTPLMLAVLTASDVMAQVN